jgi:hypothetical protein
MGRNLNYQRVLGESGGVTPIVSSRSHRGGVRRWPQPEISGGGGQACWDGC